jgi:hypothetical protein
MEDGNKIADHDGNPKESGQNPVELQKFPESALAYAVNIESFIISAIS